MIKRGEAQLLEEANAFNFNRVIEHQNKDTHRHTHRNIRIRRGHDFLKMNAGNDL